MSEPESQGLTESTRRLLLKGVLSVERSYQPDDVLTVIMQKCVSDLDETMQRLWEKNRA